MAVLLVVGIALLLIWTVSAINVIAGVRRRQRAAGITGPGYLLTQLPMLLAFSLGLAANMVTYVAALLWYRLRGKPLPPPPQI